jgi:hypothetical protein
MSNRMPDTPFMIGYNGFIADLSYNGFAAPGQATVGLVPNIATGETPNTNTPSPGPWGVTQLLPGSVIQLTGGGQYNLVSGASALQGIGTGTGPALSGVRGSIQVDIVTGAAGTAQGLAFIVGDLGPTTLYAGISLDASNRPNFSITNNSGVVVVHGTPSGSAFPANVALQLQLFWDSGTGSVSFVVNGVAQSFTPASGPWAPFVPISILYGRGANGFGTLSAFTGRLNKVQLGNSTGGLPAPASHYIPEFDTVSIAGASTLTATATTAHVATSSVAASSSVSAAASLPLQLWNFHGTAIGTLTAGQMLSTFGLTFSRTGSLATNRTSPNVVALGIANNVARFTYTGKGGGLLIENQATNYLLSSRDISGSGWVATGVVTAPGAGTNSPVGDQNAGQFNGGNAGHILSQPATVGGSGTPINARIWLKSATGSSYVQQMGASDGGVVASFNIARSATTAWLPKDQSATSHAITSLGALIAADETDETASGGEAAHLENLYIDLAQLEDGKIPTSSIVTTGASQTRGADEIVYSAGSSLVSGGEFTLYCKFVPLGAVSDYQANIYLFADDVAPSQTFAFVDPTTGNVTLSLNGVSRILSTTPVVWASGDLVEMIVRVGGPDAWTARWRTNGGASNSVGTVAASDSYAPSGGIRLFQNAGANVLTGVFLLARADAPGVLAF